MMERPTGVMASSGSCGEITVRVSYSGNEVGLVNVDSAVYWRTRDFDKVIYELIKVRDAMKEEGLL